MAVRRDCMRAQISRELLRRIVEGEYQPGDRLIELAIAKQFNTSQAPVREALRELEALRVVETESYRGTRVRGVSPRELIEASTVRGVLEEAAAPRAAEVLRGNACELRRETDALVAAAAVGDFDGYAKHNDRFHRRIVEAGDNGVLLQVWDSLMLEARTRLALRTFQVLDLRAVAASHGPITDAFDRGDGTLAGRLLRDHAEILDPATALSGPDLASPTERGRGRDDC